MIVPIGDLSDYSATIDEAAIPNPQSVSGDSGKPFVSPEFVPGAYYVLPLDEKLTFGFGMYVPFGLATDYGKDFVGRYLARKSEVMNINLQPTLSYKFTDQLSVGIGIFASYITGELTQDKSLINASPVFHVIGKSKVEGDSWKLGAKIGGLWETEKFSVGVAYTAPVDFKMKGTF